MVNAGMLRPREQFMQPHGIWGCMDHGLMQTGTIQPKGAEAGAGYTQPAPDLNGEIRHRGLAVRAGNRGDIRRLRPEEGCGHEGQPAAGVVIGHKGNLVGVIGIDMIAQYRHRTLGARIGDEPVAVGLHTLEGSKHIAGAHRPAVGRETGDIQRRSPGIEGDIHTEITETQVSSPASCRAEAAREPAYTWPA